MHEHSVGERGGGGQGGEEMPEPCMQSPEEAMGLYWYHDPDVVYSFLSPYGERQGNVILTLQMGKLRQRRL